MITIYNNLDKVNVELEKQFGYNAIAVLKKT